MPDGPEPTPEISLDIDWGENANGWDFLIENKLNFTIMPFKIQDSQNMQYIIPARIAPGKSGVAKGKESGLFPRWPADCDFAFFREDDPKEQGGIRIRSSIITGEVTREVWIGSRSKMVSIYFPGQDPKATQILYFQPPG